MILLTIGTQLPFDRLVKAVDELALSLPQQVFAQIGFSTHRPKNMEWSQTLQPAEFDRRFREASIVVSHAGIGTILAAQKHRKPLVIVPRLARYGEHRNDHQTATSNQVRDKRGVYVTTELSELQALLRRTDLEPAGEESEASKRMAFVNNIRSYLSASL